ncbi:MAG: hypothetical protein R3305_05825, partial [Gammaproteobacteria bacterium]|nr:hypothetical protein [Gammaproteobacteria bacterium]
DPDPDYVQVLIKRLRDAVLALDVEREADGRLALLGINVGAVVTSRRHIAEQKLLLELAEQALYDAKLPENKGVAVLTAAASPDDTIVTPGPWSSLSFE